MTLRLLLAFLFLASTASASVLTDEITKLEQRITALEQPGPTPGPVIPPVIPPVVGPPPPESTVSVNGSSGPVTVPAGGTLTVGVQNGGTATAWAGVYKTTDANHVPSTYFFMNGQQTPPTTLMPSATLTFTAPTTPGTYEVRLFANNMDFTQLATSPIVTVTAPTAPPVPPPAPPPVVIPPVSGGCTTNCFYVSPSGSDSNPGTQAAPWRTFGKAANTLTAGQTAVFADGTYTESTVRIVNSGTASQPIRFLAQNKHKAILSSTSGCQPAINLYTSYFTAENLRISVSPSNANCTIYTSPNTGIKAWMTQEPHIGGPATSGAVGFVARGNLIDYHASRSGAMKSNQDFSIIENNVVHSEIEVLNSNGSIIRGNTLSDGGPNGTYIVTKGGSRNIQVYNNTINVKPGGRGIILGGTTGTQWLFDPASGVECYACVAYNNIAINTSSGGQPGLLGMSGCQDCTIRDNTGTRGQVFMQGRTSRNPTFKNNSMTCDSGGAATSGYNGWGGFYSGTLTVTGNTWTGCTAGIP